MKDPEEIMKESISKIKDKFNEIRSGSVPFDVGVDEAVQLLAKGIEDQIDAEIIAEIEKIQPTGPEPRKPSDYYFMVMKEETYDENTWVIGVVTKRFWDENHYLDDSDNDCAIGDMLPVGFSNSMESCFEYTGPVEQGVAKLIEAGFTQIESPW